MFWAVSDVDRVNELIRTLNTLNINKKTYKKINNIYEKWLDSDEPVPITNPMTSAAFAYYLTSLAFNGRIGNPGFYSISDDGKQEYYTDENVKIEQAYINSIDRLPDFPERLQGLEVWCGDCRRILDNKEYNTPNTLIYLDLPYFKNNYVKQSSLDKAGLDRKEFTFENVLKNFNNLNPDDNLRNDYTSGVALRLHVDVVLLLENTKAKIMLSGYDNSLYDYLVQTHGWKKIKLQEQAVVSSTKEKKQFETEYLWTNF